jgi:alkylation response protein AidB-like acyl-CoA dehydrogenase
MTATTDPEAFRGEICAWLEANAPRSLDGMAGDPAFQIWGGKKARYPTPDARTWLDRAAEKGLTAPTWPREYGGGGLSRGQAKILEEELGRRRLPLPLAGFGLTMILDFAPSRPRSLPRRREETRGIA